MNDVTCVVSNGKMVVHADDIALYKIIQSPEDYLLVQYDMVLSGPLPTIWSLTIKTIAIFSFNEIDLLPFRLLH